MSWTPSHCHGYPAILKIFGHSGKNCNSPRHPERSEGSPANGTYLKIVPLHGDPSSQAPRDDVPGVLLKMYFF